MQIKVIQNLKNEYKNVSELCFFILGKCFFEFYHVLHVQCKYLIISSN